MASLSVTSGAVYVSLDGERENKKKLFLQQSDHGTRNVHKWKSESEICILLERDPIVILRSYRREQKKIR